MIFQLPLFLQAICGGLVLVSACFVLQILLSRVFRPKRHMWVLVIIFGGVALAGLIGLAVFFPLHAPVLFLTGVLHGAISVVYFLYSLGINDYSPTVQILEELASSGATGRSLEEIRMPRLSEDYLVSRRIRHLQEGGHMERRTDRFYLTKRGKRLAAAVRGFRRALGLTERGEG